MFLVLGSCLLSGLFPSLCPVCCCLVRVSCVQHVLSFWSKTGGLCFVSVAVCVPCLVYDTFVVLVVVFFPFLFPCTSLYVLSFYFPVPLSSSYVYSVCQCVLLPVLFLTRPQLICVMSPTDLCHIVVIYLPHAVCSVSPSS